MKKFDFSLERRGAEAICHALSLYSSRLMDLANEHRGKGLDDVANAFGLDAKLAQSLFKQFRDELLASGADCD